jgi:hypothetical protein
MRKIRTVAALALAGAFAAGIAGPALARSQWDKDHPRRVEVNHRLKTQNLRIHRKVANGRMTRPQAAALHKDDRQIRQEERDMASQNRSHISRQEQNTLNHQENRVSKQIYGE